METIPFQSGLKFSGGRMDGLGTLGPNDCLETAGCSLDERIRNDCNMANESGVLGRGSAEGPHRGTGSDDTGL
jgi:hypothetical protein